MGKKIHYRSAFSFVSDNYNLMQTWCTKIHFTKSTFIFGLHRVKLHVKEYKVYVKVNKNIWCAVQNNNSEMFFYTVYVITANKKKIKIINVPAVSLANKKMVLLFFNYILAHASCRISSDLCRWGALFVKECWVKQAEVEDLSGALLVFIFEAFLIAQ